VKTLLEKGADPNTAGQSSITPLIAAVVRGHTELAQLLINSGANVNGHTTEGVTPLMAAVNSNPDAISLLLAQGADINATDQGGIGALHAAAAMLTMVRALTGSFPPSPSRIRE